MLLSDTNLFVSFTAAGKLFHYIIIWPEANVAILKSPEKIHFAKYYTKFPIKRFEAHSENEACRSSVSYILHRGTNTIILTLNNEPWTERHTGFVNNL